MKFGENIHLAFERAVVCEGRIGGGEVGAVQGPSWT